MLKSSILGSSFQRSLLKEVRPEHPTGSVIGELYVEVKCHSNVQDNVLIVSLSFIIQLHSICVSGLSWISI